MCRAVNCRVCGKTTWAGCGQHVQSVKASVPRGDWCGGSHTADEIAASRAARPNLLTRLFGR
jgi:hypothetical protein